MATATPQCILQEIEAAVDEQLAQFRVRMLQDGAFASRAADGCAVSDGAAWMQGYVDLHRPDVGRMLDCRHALGYVGTGRQPSHSGLLPDGRR